MVGNVHGMKKPIGAQGVTTDGRGHLFVCDVHNACVQMFSVADARYMGTVLKDCAQDIGTPRLIRWCKNTLSLVVVHMTDSNQYIIRKFQVNVEDFIQPEDVIVID